MIDKIFEQGWAEALVNNFNPNKFIVLGKTINHLRKKTTVYPHKEDVFKAFKLTPYEKVRVVMLGQDPYHDSSADGLAFSQSYNSHKCAPSLKVILKEIERSFPEDVSNIKDGKIDPWDLSRWAEQGVLLLNTSLTVQKGKPGSHTIYWKAFTKAVIKSLQQKKDLVWLLMGTEAKNFSPLITNSTHGIVGTVHPAADLYSGQDRFYGSDCFKKTNEELNARNLKEIIW